MSNILNEGLKFIIDLNFSKIQIFKNYVNIKN